MTLIVDTAPLVALANTDDPQSGAVLRALQSEPGTLILPAPVTAEVDYFLATRLGTEAARGFMADLANEVYRVECLLPDDYRAAERLNLQYADLRLGLADLSVIVLASRFDTLRILTFDYRHLRAVRPLQGGSFVLLPADENAGDA